MGVQARIGSLTADLERFMPWRTTDGADVAPKGAPEMPVLIEGVFARSRLLSLMQDFTVFGDTPGGHCQDHRGLSPVPCREAGP